MSAFLPIFCCDADAFINLRDADLLRKLRSLVQSGRIKVPEGVYRELQRKTDRLAKTLHNWQGKYSVAVELDYQVLKELPRIETTYGPPFSVGARTYPGFWASASGRKSVDAQVVALAKVKGWVIVSNDDSIHGACMIEDIECRRWEAIGRLLLRPAQPPLL